MKKLILSVTAIAGLAMAGHAQQVQFFDSGSANGSVDTAINGVLNKSQNLNLELLVGSGGTAATDVVTLLLSTTTATATTALGSVQPAAGDIVGSGGDIDDHTVNFYLVPGGTTDYQVLAWTGPYSTYAAAIAAGQAGAVVDAGQTPVENFLVAPAAGSAAVTLNLDAGGTLNLTTVPTTVVPEPSTLAMAGVGLASMLMFRRRNK